MNVRQAYYADLIADCKGACDQHDIHPDDQATIISAMIVSDAVNGLRKALLGRDHGGSPANLRARSPGAAD